jgi:hypothetical protein
MLEQAKKEAKLEDLRGQDLAGWQIDEVFWVQPDHGLMGQFPAINREVKEPIVCRTRDLIIIVRNIAQQERRFSRTIIESAPALLNPSLGMAIMFGTGSRFWERASVHLYSSEEIDMLQRKNRGITWSPGLL